MKRLVVAAATLLLFLLPASAQQGKTVVAAGGHRSSVISSDGPRVQVYDLDSRLMKRKMPFAVVLPEGYSDPRSSGRTYPVVYLLHGLFGHFDNWTKKTSLADHSKGTDLIIVAAEGGDGWYTDSPVRPDDKWESYILQELIPEIDGRFRTIAEAGGRTIAGLSMGGYGAIKFGLKYPDKFGLVGSFSGALGAASFLDKIPGSIGKTIDVIFGPAGSETRKSNDVFAMIRDRTPEWKKNIPYIYLSCGTEDFLFANNREFVDLLNQKAVPHEYRELPGGHTWQFWDSQVLEFLRLAQARFYPLRKQ